MLLSQDTLPPACRCSATHRTRGVMSRAHLPLPAAAQGPGGPVVITWYPLPPDCHCSGTCKTRLVVSGLTAPYLTLLRYPQDLWYHLGTSVPCLSLLRDPQDLSYHLGTHCRRPPAQTRAGPVQSSPVHCLQPAAAQVPSRPRVSLQDTMPTAYCCSRNHRYYGIVSGTHCRRHWVPRRHHRSFGSLNRRPAGGSGT